MSLRVILNGEERTLSSGTSLAALLRELGVDDRRVAIEVNEHLVPRTRHAVCEIQEGDRIEIVTLVGGGSGATDDTELYEPPLNVGSFALRSRLIAGSGKYDSFELMQRCHELCGCHAITVAVRRERLLDKDGRNILEFIDLKRYLVLPNTAGCFSAADAVRHARLGREILEGLGHPGARWVKLECLADPRTLLPDPVETLTATVELVKDGFEVLVYTSDDPVMARRLRDAGATSVMPAGSPIGSGQGVLNPNNIRIILEQLKKDDPTYPVIIDAGVGTASDVAVAMELGCDGVLLNTAIASCADPLRMAAAMKDACQAGRLAFLAGRIPKRLYATASSPTEGLLQGQRQPHG
ncbi:MAG TPA: sulfur carrier protein ThiS [Gemmatales bacterium]|nr:sulfur carrier protein ThiS [Gemmatales bacterium]HMP58246.1 sulfur carrier protein ThiS [Gemmatales bacterium]